MRPKWFSLLRRGARDVPDGVRAGRVNAIEERLADYAEAIALAEAGEMLLAGAVMRREGQGRKRLLVVGHGAGFSARLAGYAISLAGRMDAALTFLTVGPAEAGDSTREAYAAQAGVSARYWLEAARACGVPAGHEVCFAEIGDAITRMTRSLGRVEMVLSEPEEGLRLQGRMPLALFTVD